MDILEGIFGHRKLNPLNLFRWLCFVESSVIECAGYSALHSAFASALKHGARDFLHSHSIQ